MKERIVVKRVPVFNEDVALYSIEQNELDLAIHHLSKDPLVGKPIPGEHGLREWDFRKYRIVYHPMGDYTVIVLLQIRPRDEPSPLLSPKARAILAELLKFIVKKGLWAWTGR